MSETQSPDQQELLEVLERIAVLPWPIMEDALLPLAEQALDLIEARSREIRGEEMVTVETLVEYRRRLRKAGFEVASAGVAVLLLRYEAEAELYAAKQAQAN
jgi:hypothetical protein